MCLHRRHEPNNNPRPQASLRPAQPHAKRPPTSLSQNHARAFSPSSGHGPSRTCPAAQVRQRTEPFPQSLRLADPRRYTNPAPGGFEDAARTPQSWSEADLEGHRRSDASGEERRVRGARRSGPRPQQQQARVAPGDSLRGVGRLAHPLGLSPLEGQGRRFAWSVGSQAASRTAEGTHRPQRGDGAGRYSAFCGVEFLRGVRRLGHHVWW
jgi:hypothetical protein